MNTFANADFIPFDTYVNRAKARVARKNYGRRVTDFTDAVIVTEVPVEEVPEFADTVPMPIPVAAYPDVETVYTEDVFTSDDALQAKLSRARAFVSARAFAECLHSGYFPPRCQACAR